MGVSTKEVGVFYDGSGRILILTSTDLAVSFVSSVTGALEATGGVSASSVSVAIVGTLSAFVDISTRDPVS